jgi:hypothetical protein
MAAHYTQLLNKWNLLQLPQWALPTALTAL